MPAKSASQYRLMQGIAHGSIKKPGLSPSKAKEFVEGVKPKSLPERINHSGIKHERKHKGK